MAELMQRIVAALKSICLSAPAAPPPSEGTAAAVSSEEAAAVTRASRARESALQRDYITPSRRRWVWWGGG